MTLFDIIGLLILGVSALVGLARGGIQEISKAGSTILALFISIFALRFTGRYAISVVHPAWAANAVAVAIVFIAAYVVLRTIAGAMTRSVHETRALGALDRLIGGGFGLVRGLVLLGVIGLFLSAIMPYEHMPSWITDAKLYPLSRASATALRALAPKGAMVAASLKPAVDKAVRDERAAGENGPGVRPAGPSENPTTPAILRRLERAWMTWWRKHAD